MTAAVVGIPGWPVTAGIACSGTALARDREVGAVPNPCAACREREFNMRRNDTRIEEIDVHSLAARTEVEFGIQSMRSLVTAALVYPIQCPAVDTAQLRIPALDRLG